MSNQSYLKASIDGLKGSGVTGTAARIALGISIEQCDRRPVLIGDANNKARFLQPMFQAERVPLIIVPAPTLLAMHSAITRGKQEGVCVFLADDITIPWDELVSSFSLPNGVLMFEMREQLKQCWRAFMSDVRSAPFHCIGGGRLGHNWEKVESEFGTTELEQQGQKIDAGWGNNFAYCADIELNMRRRIPVMKSVLRMHKVVQHICTVHSDSANDLTGLNGKEFVFEESTRYQPGNYRQTYNAFLPHFEALMQIENGVYPAPPSSKEMLVSGKTPWARDKSERSHHLEEITALLDFCFPSGEGKSKQAKAMRDLTLEYLNGFLSWSRMEEESLTPDLEKNVWVLRKVRQHIEAGEIPTERQSLNALLDICVDELYRPDAKRMTLIEVMGLKSIEETKRKKANGKDTAA